MSQIAIALGLHIRLVRSAVLVLVSMACGTVGYIRAVLPLHVVLDAWRA
jgi:hypothetical protein